MSKDKRGSIRYGFLHSAMTNTAATMHHAPCIMHLDGGHNDLYVGATRHPGGEMGQVATR